MKYHTKNNVNILNCLKENSDRHLNVEQIDELLNHKIPLASIYRNLDELVEEGLIRRYFIDRNTSACYQFLDNNDEHDHFHLLCVKCGKLIHLECHEVNRLIKHIEDEHDFDVDITKVTLYGICPDCKKVEQR